MLNTIQPASSVIGIMNGIFDQADHKSNKTITLALGNVEKCVIGYSNREGFFGKLGGVFYRIWNAVKAVFGQSDWQKARRALDTLVVTAIDHPVVDKMAAKIIGIYSSINNEMCSESDLKKEPDEQQALMRMRMGKSVMKNYKFSNKELDYILRNSIMFNENEGLKNIVNNGQVQNLIGDGKQLVDTVLKLVDIFTSKKDQLIELVRATKSAGKNDEMVIGKKIEFWGAILKEAVQIEGIKHLVEPLAENLPEIMNAVNGDKLEAVLPILLQNPALSGLAKVIMSNIPEVAKLGESDSFGKRL